LFSGTCILAQTKIQIWTEQTKINAVLEFERSLNEDHEIIERNVGISKSTFPYIDEYELANPIIVLRPSKNDLPIYTEYFFSLPDSTLRFVSYDWEIDRYGNYNDKQKIWKREANKLGQYNEKYEDIKTYLIDKLGQPTEQDFEPQRTKSQWGNSDYWSRKTTWENKEVISSLSLVFASNTYRIRWNYYWKE